MNITKFLRILLNESGMDGMYQFAPGERHVELVAAQSQVASLVAAYDALAPDWNEAPNWAKWYAIDCHNAGFWFDAPEPLITYDNETYDAPTWANNSICKFSAHVGLLPFGIDWRLCKWQRPEVAA